MDLNLKNHVFMVSGGSKGIGFAIARRAAAEGARVAICARTKAELDRAAQRIAEATAAEVLVVSADLCEQNGITDFVDQTMDHFGQVDVLVNCAGDASNSDFLALPDEAWTGAWQLKVHGYVRLARAVLPAMQQRSYGRIVNVIGYGGRQPLPLTLPAAMANAALLAFTKGLSQYCAADNILVNAVNPGTVRTDRWRKNVAVRARAAGMSVESYEEQFTKRTFLNRIGEPDEIAAAAVFLASPIASYITGAYLDVDGGETRCI